MASAVLLPDGVVMSAVTVPIGLRPLPVSVTSAKLGSPRTQLPPSWRGLTMVATTNDGIDAGMGGGGAVHGRFSTVSSSPMRLRSSTGARRSG